MSLARSLGAEQMAGDTSTTKDLVLTTVDPQKTINHDVGRCTYPPVANLSFASPKRRKPPAWLIWVEERELWEELD